MRISPILLVSDPPTPIQLLQLRWRYRYRTRGSHRTNPAELGQRVYQLGAREKQIRPTWSDAVGH